LGCIFGAGCLLVVSVPGSHLHLHGDFHSDREPGKAAAPLKHRFPPPRPLHYTLLPSLSATLLYPGQVCLFNSFPCKPLTCYKSRKSWMPQRCFRRLCRLVRPFLDCVVCRLRLLDMMLTPYRHSSQNRCRSAAQPGRRGQLRTYWTVSSQPSGHVLTWK
jgi:hypothetical protein